LCGVEGFHRRLFTVVITSTVQQRGEWLAEVRRTMEERFPQATNGRPEKRHADGL